MKKEIVSDHDEESWRGNADKKISETDDNTKYIDIDTSGERSIHHQTL